MSAVQGFQTTYLLYHMSTRCHAWLKTWLLILVQQTVTHQQVFLILEELSLKE